MLASSQLGISCRWTGFVTPHMHLDLFPQYACLAQPHLIQMVVSLGCLVVFVAIALLLNMSEVRLATLRARGFSGSAESLAS